MRRWQVGDVPAAFYIPEFITEEVEAQVYDEIINIPDNWWQRYHDRKRIVWDNTSLPLWAQGMIDQVRPFTERVGRVPNSLYIQQYAPGQGISMHRDAENDYKPPGFIVTLNSGSVTHFRELRRRGVEGSDGEKLELPPKTLNVYSEARSLYFFMNKLFYQYVHGVTHTKMDVINSRLANLDSISHDDGDLVPRGTRIAIVLRHIGPRQGVGAKGIVYPGKERAAAALLDDVVSETPQSDQPFDEEEPTALDSDVENQSEQLQDSYDISTPRSRTHRPSPANHDEL